MKLGLAMMLALAPLATARGKGTCNSNIPIQWVINPTYVDGTTPNAIQGDGSPYVNGSSGVTAIVNICSSTGDATLQPGSSGRTDSVSFASPIATNQNTPGNATGTVAGGWFLNVHDIMCFRCTGPIDNATEYQFTTTFSSNQELVMWNPGTQAALAAPSTGAGSVNTPDQDSLVQVSHCPADDAAPAPPCQSGQKETWYVWPLANSGKYVMSILGGKRGGQAAGEFNMPFYFVISRLQ